MRTRLRVLSARVRLRPEPIRSLRFMTCTRCMGHGYFQTDPEEAVPTVSFSQENALSYLEYLVGNRQISLNQYATTEREIVTSGLPIEIPEDVAHKVSLCVSWEEEAVRLASIGQKTTVPFTLLATDIADIIHEYLLASPGRAWLRSH